MYVYVSSSYFVRCLIALCCHLRRTVANIPMSRSKYRSNQTPMPTQHKTSDLE